MKTKTMEKMPDYSRTFKGTLFIYFLLAGTGGLFFILTLFSIFKIHSIFSLSLGTFLIICFFLGIIAFLSKSRKFKLWASERNLLN